MRQNRNADQDQGRGRKRPQSSLDQQSSSSQYLMNNMIQARQSNVSQRAPRQPPQTAMNDRVPRQQAEWEDIRRPDNTPQNPFEGTGRQDGANEERFGGQTSLPIRASFPQNAKNRLRQMQRGPSSVGSVNSAEFSEDDPSRVRPEDRVT